MFKSLNLIIVLIISISIPSLASANKCSDQVNFPKLSKINSRLSDPSYKVIVLGRHGKASQVNKFTAAERQADPEKVKLDIQRPLAKKGKIAAKRLANLMEKMEFGDVGMWGSYAKRVIKTTKPTRKVLGNRVKITDFTPDLYYADVPKEMHARLTSKQAEGLSHAFFWGHGKTTLALFKKLTGATDAFLPTSAVMIVAVKAQSWDQVFRGEGESIEGFAWSPNKSHKAEGQNVPVTTLESVGGGLEAMVRPESVGALESAGGVLESFITPPAKVETTPDFIEINL